MWERYCLGVSSIIWVVDSADPSTFPVARNELFSLLEKPGLKGIPLLVRSLRCFAMARCGTDVRSATGSRKQERFGRTCLDQRSYQGVGIRGYRQSRSELLRSFSEESAESRYKSELVDEARQVKFVAFSLDMFLRCITTCYPVVFCVLRSSFYCLRAFKRAVHTLCARPTVGRD